MGSNKLQFLESDSCSPPLTQYLSFGHSILPVTKVLSPLVTVLLPSPKCCLLWSQYSPIHQSILSFCHSILSFTKVLSPLATEISPSPKYSLLHQSTSPLVTVLSPLAAEIPPSPKYSLLWWHYSLLQLSTLSSGHSILSFTKVLSLLTTVYFL